MSELDTTGSPTSPLGFSAGAAYAGIKTYGEGKLDIGILASDRPCTAAAVFTRNRLRSAPLFADEDKLSNGIAQAVVVNSGVANSATGDRGIDDAYRMAAFAADHLGLPAEDVLVSSTGVIGHFLPMDKIEAGIAQIEMQDDGGAAFARAIMTTDTRPKHAATTFGPFTLGGCAKGSGMIHPNMATMLAYITTDAAVDLEFLQDTLREVCDRSFNVVSVDGDTSPSDTVVVMANGAAGGETILPGSSLAGEFREALEALCIYLAKEIARDGEGATKLIEFRVNGAVDDAQARQLVRELSTSYLLKSAIHGADPNWGRISAVIGRSTVDIDESAVSIAVCGHTLYERGRPTEFDESTVSESMREAEVSVEVALGVGGASATGWGCDLSAEYVHINADYTT